MATESLPPHSQMLHTLEAQARQRPNDPAALSALGAAYAQLGRSREAATLYLRMGAALYEHKRVQEAVEAWRRALTLEPKLVAAHLNLGKTYREQGDREAALREYEAAAARDPRCEPALRNLSALYFAAGRLDECEQACRRRLELAPGNANAVVSLADCLERKGDVDGAFALLAPLVTQGDDSFALAAAYLLACQRLSPPRADGVAVAQRCLARDDLAPEQRRTVLKRTAELCDRLGRVDEAFAYLEQSKALRDTNRELSGRRVDVQRLAWEAGSIYTRDRLARLPRASHGSDLPVFIVGMPRSGTSLTEQILSSHPLVHGAGELKLIPRIAAEVLPGTVGYPACLDMLTPARANQLADIYLRNIRSLAPSARRITDKMPTNFQHLGLIEILFPQARVIHCMRDPLDTCLSIYFNEINNMPEDRSLPTLGAYYRRYWELMAHWRTVLRVPVLELRYEDMIRDPETWSRELVRFCGVEWHDDCLRFHQSQRYVGTLSYHQVRKPIYAQAIGRHQAYERFLGPLRSAIGDNVLEAYAAHRLPAPY